MDQLGETNMGTNALLISAGILGLFYALNVFGKRNRTEKLPPVIPSTIPFLGHAVAFNKNPIDFLLAAYERYGPVFSFTMVGKTFTYLLGSDAAATVFNSKNEDLNAEEIYSRLTTPVFGEGVAFDVPNNIFLEQKKMFKTGLNIARFRKHIPQIEEETIQYFKRWGDEGQQDIFKALSELIILTASRCLQGKEIRKAFDENAAKLFWDLDGGFTAMAWLLPPWLPLPSFRKRDAANRELKKLYHRIIAERRASDIKEEDMLQTLMESTYKDGRHLKDDEIAGMLIGLLLAGQHTSSTTTSWACFFLAQHKHIQEALYEEQFKVFGRDLHPLDYDGLKECTLLERTIKETLRMRPPIMTMMRMCKTPQNVLGFTIPVGHQVCVSPTVNQRLEEVWEKPLEFNPDRFLEETNATNTEKFSYVPFGAGRHRCIGESFAYVQIKVILATIIRMYKIDLVAGYFPEIDYTTMIHTPKHAFLHYKKRDTPITA